MRPAIVSGPPALHHIVRLWQQHGSRAKGSPGTHRMPRHGSQQGPDSCPAPRGHGTLFLLPAIAFLLLYQNHQVGAAFMSHQIMTPEGKTLKFEIW
jgi:hypothetical protein